MYTVQLIVLYTYIDLDVSENTQKYMYICTYKYVQICMSEHCRLLHLIVQ